VPIKPVVYLTLTILLQLISLFGVLLRKSVSGCKNPSQGWHVPKALSLHNDCNDKRDLRCRSATQMQRKICVAESGVW